jgi:hypothetical protein
MVLAFAMLATGCSKNDPEPAQASYLQQIIQYERSGKRFGKGEERNGIVVDAAEIGGQTVGIRLEPDGRAMRMTTFADDFIFSRYVMGNRPAASSSYDAMPVSIGFLKNYRIIRDGAIDQAVFAPGNKKYGGAEPMSLPEGIDPNIRERFLGLEEMALLLIDGRYRGDQSPLRDYQAQLRKARGAELYFAAPHLTRQA